MGQSVVRCPLCDRRYNVTGIPSGTKVLCTSCRAVLTVPNSRLSTRESLWRRLIPESGSGQLVAALIGGLVLAGGGYTVLHGLRDVSTAALVEPSTKAPEVSNRIPIVEPGSPWATLPPDLQREFDPEKFYIHQVDPFILVGERHPQVSLPVIFEYYGELLPKLYATFQREFGDPLELKPVRGLLPIVLYTRRESFEKWWMRAYGEMPPAAVPGAYSYMERRVGLYHDRNRNLSSITSKEILLHEAIHQVVHFHYRERMSQDRPQPWWFQEGLATYFEGFKQNGRGEVVIDPSATTSRLPAAKELVVGERTKEFIRLEDLMGWDVDDIWKGWLSQGTAADRELRLQKMQYAYAQSWALVHFLRHAENGRYKTLFNEYFRHELEGKGNRDVFARLLHEKTGMEFPELEAKFKEYVASLE